MQSKFPSSSEVVMTCLAVKDYDQQSGNKILNNFLIIREIGRGVHGKVKLAQDMVTGDLVVGCRFSKMIIKTQCVCIGYKDSG